MYFCNILLSFYSLLLSISSSLYFLILCILFLPLASSEKFSLSQGHMTRGTTCDKNSGLPSVTSFIAGGLRLTRTIYVFLPLDQGFSKCSSHARHIGITLELIRIRVSISTQTF